ncbi:MAG TPA: serine/threonine-protein kinase [Kofleriaceae bacterium]|nr:serine/threonine-protein kinase [Kofleriaceae bacterium]
MRNDQYQLGELLGRGGMGQVHAARHKSGKIVAIKRVRNTLREDRLVAGLLGDEARLLAAVSHPNVVRVLDAGTDRDGRPFLVMDRASGTPLHRVLAAGPLARDRVLTIAAQLFAGLGAIHAAGIVHADLKSHNVLVDDIDIVTIIDFGLARPIALSSDPDAPLGLIAGTPAYMAPELLGGGTPNVASDLYAAGAIVYELLTGTTPFAGSPAAILTRQLTEDVEPPSRRAPRRAISAALDAVVMCALDPAPGERFASAATMAAAFAAATGQRRLARGSEIR